MQDAAKLLRELPLTAANAPKAEQIWAKSPLSKLSDGALVCAVAEAIAPPKADADSSFLTHAPLELLARAALLPMVEPAARERARLRIACIAGEYARAGEEIEERPRDFASCEAAHAALLAALSDGDPHAADAALLFLSGRASASDLSRALAEPVAPHLGAAGHAPILLAELMRAEGRIEGLGALLRAPVRAMCRENVKLHWQTEFSVAPFEGDASCELMHRLASADPVQSPSPYIAPTMLAVEADGFAASMLGDVTAGMTLDGARRAILGIAALSMLQDDPEAAPYGWTHALTMPLAVLSMATHARDVTSMVRIAATHALGFRATMGKARVDVDDLHHDPLIPAKARTQDDKRWTEFEFLDPGLRQDERTFAGVAPSDAASAAYHWPAEDRARLKSVLSTRAATHGDAHLVKYTLASFDAAGADPEAAPLYLAAAAYLGAWWDAHPEASFE